MSFKVTMEEEPRVFHVLIGQHAVGKVISHIDPEDEDTTEAYHAIRFIDDDGKYEVLGWYDTLKKAGEAVVSYSHGDSKIDKVVERPV